MFVNDIQRYVKLGILNKNMLVLVLDVSKIKYCNFINQNNKKGVTLVNYFNIVKNLAIVLLVVVSISACSSTYHVPVYSNVPDKIKSTDVTVGLNQEEVYVKFVVSNSGSAGVGFGILGAIIASVVDSAINSSSSEDAEKLAKPFRDATIDVDFSKEFASALNAQLKNVSWLKVNDVMVNNSYQYDKTPEMVKSSSSNAVLLIATNYYMDPALGSFNIDTVLTMHPNDKTLIALAEKNRPYLEVPFLYRNKIRFRFKLPTKASTQKIAIEEWVKNDANELITALRNGVAKVAEMIALDLAKIVDKNAKVDNANESETPKEVIVATGENFKIARLRNGDLVTTIN